MPLSDANVDDVFADICWGNAIIVVIIICDSNGFRMDSESLGYSCLFENIKQGLIR